MAAFNGIAVPGIANADLSSYEGYGCKLSSGKVVQVVTDTDADLGGVLVQVHAAAADARVGYVVDGEVEFRVGTGGCTEQKPLMVTSDGWIDATSGKIAGIVALETSTVGALAKGLVIIPFQVA